MDWKKGLIMDKIKARKMYELATRLSGVNASELSEQQLAERNQMIGRLQEEMTKIREAGIDPAGIEQAGGNATPGQGTHYNINKLGGEIGVDPRVLRTAIQRSLVGNPTRQDTLTLADAFLSILKNGDDQTIQNIANIIKSGNPRKEVPQESTASIAERNAFVDAMRQVKKGDKFTVGGKEFTKTTDHGTDSKEEVKEEINTEAYDRLRKVFDFSNFKG
jgi:hypothetical protein